MGEKGLIAMLHKHPKELMCLKQSSGISRGRGRGIRALSKAAKTGEMPVGINAMWGEPRIKAYEMIDKLYTMPKDEYLLI